MKNFPSKMLDKANSCKIHPQKYPAIWYHIQGLTGSQQPREIAHKIYKSRDLSDLQRFMEPGRLASMVTP